MSYYVTASGGGVTSPVSVSDGGTGLTTITQHALIVGDATNSVVVLAVGATNEVLLGNTGADASWGTVSNAALTNSSITLSNGNNVTITGSPVSLGGTATINVSGTTNHAIQIGDATGSLDSLAIGVTNEVLLGNTGANPSWGTVGNTALTNSSVTLSDGANITVTGSPLSLGGTATIALSGATYHAVQVGSAAGALDSLGVGLTAQVLKGNTGANPSWGAVDLTTDVSGYLPVGSGGTGIGTIAAHSLIVGDGTSAVNTVTAATNGQVLVGSTGADPVFHTLTSSDSTITFTTGAGTLSLQTASAIAKSFSTDSGSATPSSGVLTITGGTNCTTSGSGSIITINASGGGGITWSETTATTQALAVDNGYICNNASQVVCTLPDTAALGSVVKVCGKGSGGWKIAQNASESIIWDEDTSTTTGTSGYLESTDDYDVVELLCTVANTTWTVLSSKGNITVS